MLNLGKLIPPSFRAAGSELYDVFVQKNEGKKKLFFSTKQGIYSFDSSRINAKEIILQKLTEFSQKNKVACLISIVAFPILAMLIGKIAMIVGLGLSLGIIAGLVYLNSIQKTTAEKATNWLKAHNPFAK